jgi:hypothetical protein
LVSPPCLSFLGGGGDGEAEHGPHGRDGEEEGERGDGATGEEEEEEGAPAESNRAAAAKFFLLKPTGRFTFLPLLPIAIVECKFSRQEKFSIRFTIFLHVEHRTPPQPDMLALRPCLAHRKTKKISRFRVTSNLVAYI